MSQSSDNINMKNKVDSLRSRYPFCVVWTPIPILTWLFPFIGHAGIGLSNGVIRDFACSYHVAQGQLAFGKPTKYWELDVEKVDGGSLTYDDAIQKASDVYVNRQHNLLFDNCHSYVALALNKMNYNGKNNWNMFKIATYLFFKGKYVSCLGVFKTYLPFLSLLMTLTLFIIFLN